MKITAEVSAGNTSNGDDDWHGSQMLPWTVTLIRDDTEAEYQVPFWTGALWTSAATGMSAPTAADVLPTLLMERDSIANSEGFDDWAAEFNYDTDSRRAFAMWERCKVSAAQLDRWIGDLYPALEESRLSGEQVEHDDEGSVLVEVE